MIMLNPIQILFKLYSCTNEINIEKNPKNPDDVTQKHEINDTLKVGANLGLLYFFSKIRKSILVTNIFQLITALRATFETFKLNAFWICL